MNTLLVVDPSATNRLQLRLMAERLGHRVLLASSNEEAVGLLATDRPDAILIDLGRVNDRSDGFLASVNTIPIIVVANPDETGQADGPQLTVTHKVLLRPFDQETLQNYLSTAFTTITNGNSVHESVSKPGSPPSEPASVSGLLHLLAHLGHDLRTPLNAILGFSDMLADEVADLGEASLSLDVRRIHGAGERMLAMVDEVVDLARADLGQLTLVTQSFPAREAIETLKSEIQADASLPPVTIEDRFEADAPTLITTDARRFRQTISAFIKVVRQGGTGPVSLHGNRTGENLSICLTAPKFGLNANEIRQALGPLNRAQPDLLAKAGGLCLGLALAHRVVQIMGGSIQVSDDNGISIHISIPPGQSSSAYEYTERPAQSSHVEADPRPLKILLAEDSPVNQSLMRSILKRIGREADVASNGLEVLAMLRKSHYDLILMDVNMPEMDGLEAAHKIRAGWPVETRPKIIALTGAVTPQDIAACKEAGMIDYLAKPIQSPALKAAIERLL